MRWRRVFPHDVNDDTIPQGLQFNTKIKEAAVARGIWVGWAVSQGHPSHNYSPTGRGDVCRSELRQGLLRWSEPSQKYLYRHDVLRFGSLTSYWALTD